MPKFTEMDLVTGVKTDITIDETKDFKGAGGEKKIFVKGQRALGVYHDPDNAMPVERCTELAVLTHPGIVRPQGLLYKGANRVGETMMAVVDPWILCSLFTMTFRKQHHLDQDRIAAIAKLMNEIVCHAHQHGIAVVDNNENNWLLSADFRKVFAIDTGNWQTKSFRATMIMLNIRDPFNPAGPKADWYAQAILLANLYIGKHPFEATHPKYKDIPKAKDVNGIPHRPMMEAMMKDRVAFFDPACTLNRACYPLDSIPSALRHWMQATLMGDLRTEPPTDFNVVAVVRALNALTSSHKFEITKLFTTVGDILHVVKPGLKRVILTDKKWYVDQQAYDYPENITGGMCHVAFTSHDEPILAYLAYGMICLYRSNGEHVECSQHASSLISIHGRLICTNLQMATELELMDLGDRISIRRNVVGQILDIPNATKAYPGCLVQNMLGSWRVSTFPQKGRCIQTRLTDLEDGSQVMDAKYEAGALMVVSQKNGIYSRRTFFENADQELFQIYTEPNVANEALNWTVNGRGTMTNITEDGTLLATKVGSMGPSTAFTDPVITSEMRLSAEGNKTHFFSDNFLYSISVK